MKRSSRNRPVTRLPLSALLAFAFLQCMSLNAFAHEDDDPAGHDTRAYDPDYDPERYRSPRYGAFEFRIGPYFPQVDSEFGGATPFADSFGDSSAIAIGFEADWQALRIPHFGSLGPGLGWHYTQKSGVAPFAGPPLNDNGPSAHKQRFWLMPMYLVAVLRVDVFAKEFSIPVVPYLKGGLAVGLWESRDASQVSEFDDVRGQGLETGLQFQLGAMLHLNPLSRQASIDMDNTSGVNDAYLYIEWWKSSVDSFGKGMQVGTSTWMAGLAIEF